MNRVLPIAAFILLSWTRPWLRSETPLPLAPERELASLVPARCLIYLEGTGLLPLLEQGLEHAFVRALRTSPLGQVLLAKLTRSPGAALALADSWLGEPVLPSLADLTRRGISLGFDPATKKALIVAIGRDAETVEQRVTHAFDALERQFGWPGGLDQPHKRWSGADVWSFGAEAIVAKRGELLVLGNDAELVSEALELAADPEGRGLLDRPGFVAHHAARPREATLWSWLELAELEPHADEGFRELRGAQRSPAGQGLLGAETGALLGARALSIALTLHGEESLVLRVRAFEAPCVAALAPLARDGAVPAEIEGENVGTALFYRDYSRYFTERAELFPPEVQAGFAEAITNGALFFEGQDLGTEVLPRLSPWIRLVSRELAFSEGRRPEIPLPGLAAVAVLDDPRVGEQWTAAFQSLISIINVDQAQKGGKSMRLYLGREGEIEISAARYTSPGPSDGVDVRYNLEPALAVVGRHLVLGTHESLVRALVRELDEAQPREAVNGRESLTLDARGLRTAVHQNFEALVAQKMLEGGLERAAAESEIEGLRLALASLEGLRLELEGADPSAPELRLELRLARPESPR